MHVVWRALLVSVTVIAFVGCYHAAHQAPVRERQQPPSAKIFRHLVAPGETLFSIAWRYGLDYKKLAIVNGIDATFVIYPGDVLDLRADQSNAIHRQHRRYRQPKKSVKEPPKEVSAPTKTRAQHSAAQAPAPSSKDVASKDVASKDVASKGVASRPPPPAVQKSTPVKPLPSAQKSTRSLSWQWPLAGPLLNTFSGTQGRNKGIDIKAKKGDKVAAAAAGTIVYAGSGLRGYGKLLIIKHNDVFLSAYGHNSRLWVKEGESVDGGQHIADVGASGARVSKLHFEIRREGKPVNPLHYLPKNKP